MAVETQKTEVSSEISKIEKLLVSHKTELPAKIDERVSATNIKMNKSRVKLAVLGHVDWCGLRIAVGRIYIAAGQIYIVVRRIYIVVGRINMNMNINMIIISILRSDR